MIWPNNKKSAIVLSFDLDFDLFWRHKLISQKVSKDELVTRSMGQYGANIGIKRILNLLKKYDIKATFFVPGMIAEEYTEIILGVKKEGHEIALHGYDHLSPGSLSKEEQAYQIKKGKEAIENLINVTPVGFRSPGEMFMDTLNILIENGILYDSSLMGHDIPYKIRIKNKTLVEFPWRFVSDDFVFYSFSFSPVLEYKKSPPVDGRILLQMWKDEMDTIYNEGLYFTIIGHPHLIGQPSRIKNLEKFIQYLMKMKDLWITTYSEIFYRCYNSIQEIPLKLY